MSEEEQIEVADDVNSVEQSSLQASDGEALISSLLKTRTMMTEEIGVEINPSNRAGLIFQVCLKFSSHKFCSFSVYLSWLGLMKEFEFEDFMNLGSSYDKKAHEIDEGDNGSMDEVEELEAKVESWISSRCENHNVASNTQNSSILNVDDEAPLRDPTKTQCRGQGNKRKRDSLEDKLPKKKTPCKRKGSKGEDSTTKAVTTPLKEVEEDENAHETTSTQGPHVEQPNMAAYVGMNILQVPNVAWCL
ncbi:hypothetical protein RHMOL_Rhmol02G0153300 [Rhododendron molle]|uniref:Uncharacterized protein n=1 Tax=Rhododendron molle TaxID=49168 RepID=A0ACC0PRT7_RHOML|nr:hypothetical protein RHMOL_Rhmol02G0153300 [Rhododendron molle]